MTLNRTKSLAFGLTAMLALGACDTGINPPVTGPKLATPSPQAAAAPRANIRQTAPTRQRASTQRRTVSTQTAARPAPKATPVAAQPAKPTEASCEIKRVAGCPPAKRVFTGGQGDGGGGADGGGGGGGGGWEG